MATLRGFSLVLFNHYFTACEFDGRAEFFCQDEESISDIAVYWSLAVFCAGEHMVSKHIHDLATAASAPFFWPQRGSLTCLLSIAVNSSCCLQLDWLCMICRLGFIMTRAVNVSETRFGSLTKITRVTFDKVFLQYQN